MRLRTYKQTSTLSTNILQLKRSQNRIRYQHRHQSKLIAHITTVRANHLRRGSDILPGALAGARDRKPFAKKTHPGLVHAEEGERDADEQRARAGEPHGQAAGVLPGGQVVAADAGAEIEVLDEQDEGEAQGPVAEDGQQVVEDGLEDVAAAVGKGEDG